MLQGSNLSSRHTPFGMEEPAGQANKVGPTLEPEPMAGGGQTLTKDMSVLSNRVWQKVPCREFSTQPLGMSSFAKQSKKSSDKSTFKILFNW